MSPISSNDLHRIFNKLDKNRDGLICLQELNWLLDTIGIQLTTEELESFLEKPSLDFNEFLFFYESISNQNKGECKGGVGDGENEMMMHGNGGEEDIDIVYMAFKVFDMNDDGFISCEELQNVLLRLELWDANRSDDCKSMIQAYDTNLDGKLDFEEFKNMMLLTSS